MIKKKCGQPEPLIFFKKSPLFRTMAKVALPSREKAKASASFAFSMPQRQQGRFLRAEGKLPAVFPSSPFPSFFRFLIKCSHSLFYRVPGKKTNLRTRKKRSSFQHGATGERDTFPISLTALHFPLEIPVLNHLPPNRFIQNRRLFQKPPFLSFSSLSLPCPTGLGRQIAL